MKPIFIIAEAGVNHNGRLDIAYKMIDTAKAAGADAVKFQTFKSENVVSKFALKAEYQKKTTLPDESQLDMVKRLELSADEHKKLVDYCYKQNIMFLSSPFDIESIALLDYLGLDIFKIPSGELTNLPYLKEIGKLNKEIILSTGMSNLGEIESAISLLTEYGTKKDKITLLHCNTQYPAPFEDVNLKAMITLKDAFKLRFGYSDHTLGIEVSIAAAAMGACVIEKHFTLDKNMEGPDHQASLDPYELKAMVKAVRNIEKALGSGIKKLTKSESDNIKIARKSIVARKDIKKDELFTEDNITVKRPGNGINPMRWNEIIGTRASKNYQEDDLI